MAKKRKWRLLVITIGACLVWSLWPTRPKRALLEKADSLSMVHASDIANKDFAVLIDYSMPVFRKRLWVVDLKRHEILLNCHVSHAFQSGLFWPIDFSNEPGSRKSCIGAFLTGGANESNYGKGAYKLGMKIHGLDKGHNDKANERNIVFHSNYWFWSDGCFMTLTWVNKEIIDMTKNGQLVVVGI